MAEKDPQHKNHAEADTPKPAEEKASSEPRRKKRPPESTLESKPVELPAHKAVRLHYQYAPPPMPYGLGPEEPPKKVPVVPPGNYEEDVDDSPPVDFERQQAEGDSACGDKPDDASSGGEDGSGAQRIKPD